MNVFQLKILMLHIKTDYSDAALERKIVRSLDLISEKRRTIIMGEHIVTCL